MRKFKTIIAILLVAFLLRIWQIGNVPPSLFGDELDLGYQAYSILKTGKDYYGNFLPVHFHSLAEWRTPLYLYSAVPTVAIFGITPLGVRLPAVVFGVLSILAFYLFIRYVTRNEKLATITALILSINPWHIQYSRAGFEVTEMLFFLIFGIYLFFKGLDKPKYLWLSAFSLCLTPWVYSTAKLFTPMLMLFLVTLYRKELFAVPKKYLVATIISGLLVGLPIAISTINGGGAQRFGYISVFTNPVTETEVGTYRLNDAHARGEKGTGLNPTLLDRVIHNKFTYWGKNIVDNYVQSFSTEFLFIKGDINLRHSMGIGEFYKVELPLLILGIIFFATSKELNARLKLLMLFWLLVGIVPAAITRDGGNHATRLFIVLPIYIFLISSGIHGLFVTFDKTYIGLPKYSVLGGYLVCMFLYLHTYYAHYPYESERWWHYGFGPAITEIKKIDKDYDRVIISTSNEPPWIFFAGSYEYDPVLWQKEFPIGRDVEVAGFGTISHTGKFYFGSPDSKIGIYGIPAYMDSKTLYLANAKEVGANLMMEPERVPAGLRLIKAIAYPSGEPAFYIFTKDK